MKKEYIHYGCDASEFHEIPPIRNEKMFTKPQGGLWASPVDADFGWKDWCELENFQHTDFNKSFKFTIKDDAKILHINKANQLDKLPQSENTMLSRTMMTILDFEKLQKEYDGMELHLSEEVFPKKADWNYNGLYWRLYGWDCDSILIFNEKAIQII